MSETNIPGDPGMTASKDDLPDLVNEVVARILEAGALSPEEAEASQILERVGRELDPLEKRVERLMHLYGL